MILKSKYQNSRLYCSPNSDSSRFYLDFVLSFIIAMAFRFFFTLNFKQKMNPFFLTWMYTCPYVGCRLLNNQTASILPLSSGKFWQVGSYLNSCCRYARQYSIAHTTNTCRQFIECIGTESTLNLKQKFKFNLSCRFTGTGHMILDCKTMMCF